MVKKWLHLNYWPRNPWGFKITAAMNKAVEAGRFPPAPREIGEFNLSVTTRLDMLTRILARIGQGLKSLEEMIKNHGPEHVFTPEREGYAFDVDEDTKYNLLIDIDSFLFECNACCDLVGNTMMIVYNHIGQPISKEDIGRTIYGILKTAGQSTSWFVLLDNNRNKFIHNASPYIAVDISNEEDNKYGLLIMNENIHTFEDRTKFMRLSDLSNITRGLSLALPVLEDHIAGLYAERGWRNDV